MICYYIEQCVSAYTLDCRVLRELAILRACESNNLDCVSTARLLFDQWLDNPDNNQLSIANSYQVYTCSVGRITCAVDLVYDKENLRNYPVKYAAVYSIQCYRDIVI